jgi:hypothetical protein
MGKHCNHIAVPHSHQRHGRLLLFQACIFVSSHSSDHKEAAMPLKPTSYKLHFRVELLLFLSADTPLKCYSVLTTNLIA